MPIRHAVLRFDPSSSPIAAGDAGTLHTVITKGNFGYNDIYIRNIKASVRVLQAEFPPVVPIMGFFISKGVIASPNSQVFPLWNSSTDFYQPETFYHHIFNKFPENTDTRYYDNYLVDSGDNLIASLTIDNLDTVNTYSSVIRIHLTIGYEF